MAKLLLLFVCLNWNLSAKAAEQPLVPDVLVTPAFVMNPINDASDIEFKSVENLAMSLGTIDDHGNQKLESIEIKNNGGNQILPESLYYASRTWEFNYSNGVAQDLGLYITDNPIDGVASHEQDTWMGFYPRKTLPQYRVEENQIIVTLPTGETVAFDKNSGLIVDGVLSETAPMAKGSHILTPPKVSYTGSGVFIRADSVANSPQRNGNAIITKGDQTCRVPKVELWPDTSQSSAMHFKFLNDDDLDAFLRRTCHFGLGDDERLHLRPNL